MNPVEYHSDSTENKSEIGNTDKSMFWYCGCLTPFVFYPPIAGTVAALRFHGVFSSWISLNVLVTIYVTAFLALLIYVLLIFPIVVGWAIHKRKPLPAFIAVALLIYSWYIIMSYSHAIT